MCTLLTEFDGTLEVLDRFIEVALYLSPFEIEFTQLEDSLSVVLLGEYLEVVEGPLDIYVPFEPMLVNPVQVVQGKNKHGELATLFNGNIQVEYTLL